MATACGSAGADGDSAGAAFSAGPSSASSDRQAYLEFARGHGVTTASSRALVIGIRGQDKSGKKHPTVVGPTFDDRLVVVPASGSVVTLDASTHPFETHGTIKSGIPDVDNDGEADVGMIRPGVYSVKRRDASQNILGEPTFRVLTPSGSDKLPGFRNTDHDDTYSAAERSASESRGDVLTAVLFHDGEQGAPIAVGCQVLRKGDMHSLAALVGDQFDYLLVDANEEDVPQP
jgi:hypothetical protein